MSTSEARLQNRRIQPVRDSRNSVRRGLALTLLLALTAFGFGIQNFSWVQIEAALESGPKCFLKSWFGIQCSFCGMTHSWIAAFKGDWTRAWNENHLGLPLLIGTVALALVTLINPKINWVRPSWATPTVALLLIYAISRNLV